MKKEIKTINKGQQEMKNTISEMKNTVEGIKSRLDEAEDHISKPIRQGRKKNPERARKVEKKTAERERIVKEAEKE